jgi:hypothetical protein
MGATVRRNVFFFFDEAVVSGRSNYIKKKNYVLDRSAKVFRSERLFVAEKICKSTIRIIQGEVVLRGNKLIYETS